MVYRVTNSARALAVVVRDIGISLATIASGISFVDDSHSLTFLCYDYLSIWD